MKKGLFIIFATILVFIGYLFYNNRNRDNVPKKASISQNDPVLNEQLQILFSSYTGLHDAFVNWDDHKTISELGKQIATQARSLPLNGLKTDPLLINTAKNYSDALINACLDLSKDTSINQQRHNFYTLSKNMYKLLQTVQYNKTAIYYIQCPMAFNGSGEAYWLSEKAEVINPYFGKKDPQHLATMLHCGVIEDSLNYK